MGDPGRATAQREGAFARWCWVAGVAVLVLVAVLAGPFDPATRAQVSRGAIATAGLVGAVSCAVGAVRSTGRRRRAWGTLSLAGLVGMLGNLYAALVDDPYTGDAAYIAALALAVVGLAFFPTERPRGAEITRMLLDSVVVGGSVLYIALSAVAPRGGVGPGLPDVGAYALPVVDALLATFAVLVMTRSSEAERVPLVLVGSGFVAYAVADVAYALLSAGGGFTFGSPVDVGWVAGYLAGGLAAQHPAASGWRTDGRRGSGSPVLGTVVTFSLFLGAALVRVGEVRGGVPWATNVLWVVVLVAVVLRQVLVVVDNETLRHTLERRVEERTAQLRSLASEREHTLESVADGIYGVDAAGRVTFVNAAAARILGALAVDLVGRDAHATFHAPAEDGTPYPVEHCYITEAVRDGITVAAELDVYRRLDGREVPVEVTASPLRDGDVVRGAVVAFRDVTERRAVDRMKDEFVSVVSHELRTPLTSIRGALGLIDSGVLDASPDQAARMVRIALTSSERLSRLVDDILDIERMDAGNTRLELGEHGVGALVAAAAEQVSVLADEAGVVVRSVASAEVVRADGERIVQALTNLLSNAVKFSPRGGTVRVSAVPAGDLVELRVDDEGRGIPPDKLEAVFRRFEQVDASDARERGGTGLGLAIARGIVEQHGGRMWAVSEGEGRGSSFRFTLRRVAQHTVLDAAAPGDASPGAAATTRVVVVDDDAAVVAALRPVLAERGYEVVGAADGPAALAALEREPARVVVLDLAVPDAGGARALSRLRYAAVAAPVPTLIVPVAPASLAGTVRDVVRLRPHRQRVLLVGHDDALLEAVAADLARTGLSVTRARSAAGAREALAGGLEPDLVVLGPAAADGAGDGLVADLRRDGRLQQVPLVVHPGDFARDRGAEGVDEPGVDRTVSLGTGRGPLDVVLPRVLDLLDAAAGRAAGVDARPDLSTPRTP
ncbi:ATP-binding protein [Puerhibacterium puerhi]|uniref:ATP-binding protein n=1 Tax=Puerhibacterium puerhi TaxID=2692623 RepID=UPI00135BB8C9|nr:ATP-binding protein [Puerhibacterium puerhi]